MFALQWHYLIFLLPMGVSILYLGLYVLSGWTFGDADSDSSIEQNLDVEGDVEAELDLEADVDVGTNADAHAEIDGHAGASSGAGHALHHEAHHDAGHTRSATSSSAFKALTWLGVSRVPLSLVLMVLFMTFGFIGFASNRILDDLISGPFVFLASLPIAVIGSLLVTGLISNTMARWLPLDQTFVATARQLVGLRGVAIYDINPDRPGTAIVRDSFGNRQQVAIVSDSLIVKNSEVVLVSFDSKRRSYKAVEFHTRQFADQPADEM